MATYEVKRHKGGLVATFDTQEEAANYIQSKDDPALYVDTGDALPPVVEPEDYLNKSKYEGELVIIPTKEILSKYWKLHLLYLGIFGLNLFGALVTGTFISGNYLYGLSVLTGGYLLILAFLVFTQRSRYILTPKGEADYKAGAEDRKAIAAAKDSKIDAAFTAVVRVVLAVIGLCIFIWVLSGIPAIPLAIIVGALIIAAAIQSNKG